MPLDNLEKPQVSQETVDQLPDEVRELMLIEQQQRSILIEALEKSIITKRTEAINFRAASGIEKEWIEDEEFFEGIDDANRHEAHATKPNHPSGVVTTGNSAPKHGSTIFMNITRQYVKSAAASVSEMGNPNDDRNFSFRPTPIPELEEHKNNQAPHPAVDAATGQQVQATVADFALQEIEAANKKMLAAQTRVDDWLVQCGYHSEMRRAVLDEAMLGTGIIKGPFPKVQKLYKTVKDVQGNTSIEMKIDTVPASERKSCWYVYPDPLCGEDIQNGSYIFDLDFANARGLRDMKLLPGYLPDQIDKVLEEGPQKSSVLNTPNAQGQGSQGTDENSANPYQLWYYYGVLSKEEVEALKIKDQLDGNDPVDKMAIDKIELLEACPCVVTLVNNTIIRASLNPLDSGDFPLSFLVWERRAGTPWGRGVARIMREAQRVVNAGIRNMLTNAGLSGGVQIGIKKGAIRPLNGGEMKLTPITFWELIDPDVSDIRQAISFNQIPSMQKELLNIIQFGQKMAEDVTGMPLLLQGQTGSAPDTVGGMQLLNTNATATRRMIARQIDDDIKGHFQRYYKWILIYGDESEKGDWQVDVSGSQMLVEKDIARQFSIQMVDKAQNAAFGIDPYKAMKQVLRAQMINPEDWQYDEDTYKKNIQAQSKQGIPAVQVAQIRAASAEKIEAAREASDAQVAKLHADSTVQAVQARTARDDDFMRQKLEAEVNVRREEIANERELALLKYATQEKLSLNDVKSQLAQTGMKLQVEKELSAAALRLEAATHVSDKVHAQAAQETDEGLQGAAQTHQQSLSDAQRKHEKELELLRQKHAAELQAAQHAHDINVANLKPAVQIPGRARNKHKLDQT